MKRSFASSTALALLLASSVAAGRDIEADAVGAIDRYCNACWRQAAVATQDWEDCTQQVFVDLLERVSRDRFATAMNHPKSAERRQLHRAIWSAVQRWRRTRRPHQLGDSDSPDFRLAHAEELAQTRDMIVAALPDLTERQQDIVARFIDGASVADIATELGTTPARVSDEKYKAIQKLRQKLGSDVTSA